MLESGQLIDAATGAPFVFGPQNEKPAAKAEREGDKDKQEVTSPTTPATPCMLVLCCVCSCVC